MPTKSLSLIVLVSLTVLSVLPTLYVARVEAVNQSGHLTWSPFGPRTDRLEITVYSDIQAMFDAFIAGQVDITDWPVSPGDIASFESNPDFFLTNSEGGSLIFELDRNHHKPFLGIPQQTARIVPTPGILTNTTATGCATGYGQVVVNLKSGEEGDAALIDADNKVRATGPVAISPASDGGNGPVDGTYTLVGSGPGGCTLAGIYTINTSVYRGSGDVFVGSSNILTVNLRVNYNSYSTVKQTPAGREIGRALAHLLDKPSYMSVPPIAGLADFVDVQSPPIQGLENIGGPSAPSRLAQQVLQEDCAFHPWKNPCSPFSAYNLTPDNIGGGSRWYGAGAANVLATAGFSGVDDVRAACDHFVNAGFILVEGTCQDLAEASAVATQPGSYAHLSNNGQQISLYPRTDPRRRAFGAIYGDTLNFMFGTPNFGCTVLYKTSCTPRYYTILEIVDVVFSANVLDDWDLYTAGWALGTIPDQLWRLYNSDFSGGVCAGVPEEFPDDYVFYCNPENDGETNAAQFSSSLSDADTFFKRAVLIEHRDLMTVPVFTLASQFVALNGWNFQPGSLSSLVQELGLGFQSGFWSLLNMRQKPGYVPSSSVYAPGGGDTGLIRRGFSEPVLKLSPFHATTWWDFEVLNQIYDSMLKPNPRTGGSGQQFLDWQTTTHTQTVNAQGNTVQTWTLRNDLKWHDGLPVTSQDAVFSILAFRDLRSCPNWLCYPTISAVALGPKTIQVTLEQQSFKYEALVGLIPLLPKHVWAPLCGDPPNPWSPCGDPGFDPMAAGIMVGNGPWVCKNLNTGMVGGSCVRNSDGSLGGQQVDVGGKIILSANNDYFRGRPDLADSSLHKLGWADKDNNGAVNILDIADAALHFGAPDSYWNTGQNPLAPSVGVDSARVDIAELATVAFYFDHGTTKPYQPSQLQALDPCIDPFFQASPPC